MSWKTDVSVWLDKPNSIQVFSDDGREQDYIPERTCRFKPYRDELEKGIDENGLRGICSECSCGYMNSSFIYCPNCGARVVE